MNYTINMLSNAGLENVMGLSQFSRCSLVHRYVCMTVPKVGCSTVRRTLHAFEGLGTTPISNLEQVHYGAHSIRFEGYQKQVVKHMIESPLIYKFAFVRNPYDRLFSAWKSKIWSDDPKYLIVQDQIKAMYKADRVTFDVFVEAVCGTYGQSHNDDAHWRPQVVILNPSLINYDFIGKFERFSSDFLYVLNFLEAPNEVKALAVQKTNSTEQIHGVYSQRTADLVFNRYKLDFEMFHYDKNSWVDI